MTTERPFVVGKRCATQRRRVERQVHATLNWGWLGRDSHPSNILSKSSGSPTVMMTIVPSEGLIMDFG